MQQVYVSSFTTRKTEFFGWTASQVRAAKRAGFKKSKTLHGLRIAAADKPGLCAKLTQQVADAGINPRGLSAAAIGRRAIFHLAFDCAADTNKAMRCLKKVS